MWTKDLFGTDKPIIALLHLDALPGEPAFCGSLDTIMEHAAADLKALQDGGVDGVLIANEYCFPITPHTSTVTLMAMAAVIGSLKKDIRVPFGVNVVYNPEETIKMAAALGASFGRSAFGGAYTGAYGRTASTTAIWSVSNIRWAIPRFSSCASSIPKATPAWATRPRKP